jgi:hypothetical protein
MIPWDTAAKVVVVVVVWVSLSIATHLLWCGLIEFGRLLHRVKSLFNKKTD